MNASDTPKVPPVITPGEGTIAARVAAGLGLRPSPLDDQHFGRLAIVYVRQSDPQQVLNHIESRERQYALVDLAAALGWPRNRILLIDEDQGDSGKTADWRTGYHRLLAEVTMDHVGLILGIEMSRVARNNKDWHHLMEMCASFGTMLADEDRFYDPRDAEDRLVLGINGNISEYELFLMHNRLERGRLHNANWCALFLDVPCGYVKLPTGEVARDPDEQVQSTVQLIFDKVDELGSCKGRLRGVSKLRGVTGFAGSGPVFGFREAVMDSLDLVTERTGANEGAIGPENQVAHAVRMGQPESRGQTIQSSTAPPRPCDTGLRRVFVASAPPRSTMGSRSWLHRALNDLRTRGQDMSALQLSQGGNTPGLSASRFPSCNDRIARCRLFGLSWSTVVSALGANWVQDWKCYPNAATMSIKPGLGRKALK